MEEKAQVEASKAEVQTTKVEVVEEVREEVPLTQEMLDTCSYELKEHFRAAGKKLELAILDQHIKLQGTQVKLGVMGHVQEEIANKMRPELTGLIRRLTGANKFSIKVEISEEVESTGPKLYTNTDKFNFLKEKHPALMELQRKFGLDVDF